MPLVHLKKGKGVVTTIKMVSGASVLVTTWLFIIAPSFYCNTARHNLPASYTGIRPKIGYLFNFGLIASGIGQAAFVFSITSGPLQERARVGFIIYLLACFFLVVIGFVTLKRSSKIHGWGATAYFVLAPLGILLISVNMPSGLTSMVSIAIPAIALTGTGYLWSIKNKKSFAQYWYMLMATVWVSFFLINPA